MIEETRIYPAQHSVLGDRTQPRNSEHCGAIPFRWNNELPYKKQLIKNDNLAVKLVTRPSVNGLPS
jgi:hypothetical protein